MKQPDQTDLNEIALDAARWRELTNLLREKAYKPMTPAEICEQLPDLRQLYREINHRSNGHSRDIRH